MHMELQQAVSNIVQHDNRYLDKYLEVGEHQEASSLHRKYRILLSHVSMEQKKTFSHSKCLIPISVGQTYHEDAKLRAALQCVDKHFKEIIILVGDTIQRYNHAAIQNKSQEELCDFAKAEGDKWLERNMPAIESILKKPYQVLRWNYHLEHARFDLALSIIEDAYENGDYKFAFEQDAKNFLQRSRRNSSTLSKKLCLQYLKEESACIYLWAEESCEFLAYPGGFNNVFRATRDKFIETPYNGILKEITYKFKGKTVAQVS